jgi:hypothetical protein
MLSAEGDQAVGEFRSRPDTGHRLDDRLDLFAKIFVGHAKHHRVGDIGMGDQQVLAFLRIDVDPPEMIMKVRRSVR